MSTAPGRIMGKPSVKALRKRLSGRVADDSDRKGYLHAPASSWSDALVSTNEGFDWR
jgi:hypothetical protein